MALFVYFHLHSIIRLSDYNKRCTTGRWLCRHDEYNVTFIHPPLAIYIRLHHSNCMYFEARYIVHRWLVAEIYIVNIQLYKTCNEPNIKNNINKSLSEYKEN